ncbi:N-acetylmuramoyl-L-alanine amidase [Marinobacterium zhoushanense]|uniref:N-acetylmuramoyl-L-alanine amidase n=1 Tax=Marinobacterium zhoushanense TaxID=1679163 RepID=A0ABQ1KV67_9GAMM|nr:N-acetylmuramoyl-L-alanine amidase [Marinobacterium zhoushanense]GGC11529.1 N-acetylmuramoyl-L-alanine amidase [Marinobacterium zhoushanense]
MGLVRILTRFALLLMLVSSALAQASTNIENIRVWLAPDNVRLVFDLSAPVDHNLFMLDNPRRLVLDVKDTRLGVDVAKLGLTKGPIAGVRTGRRDEGVRLVLDLSADVSPKSFQLKPNDQYGHRLVLDLETGEQPVAAAVSQPKASAPSTLGPLRDIVVAVDAGHGGEDPGALGPGRIREKNVVLEIAKEVARLIDAEPGYRAELVRSGDYYVSLRGRTLKARKINADLFVSIHADAARDKRARGASVWVLSGRGATSEMGRWLASKENSADLIGGVGSVSLEDKDEVLASVLLDMSMTASQSSSREVAKRVHDNIAGFARMHKPYVEQAGFVVLKSPDIPSILVETGFISNPQEAEKLSSSSYQKQMARAIAQGVKAHFWERPPAMTRVAELKRSGAVIAAAERTYKVAPGDTLSVIAVRNGVSLDDLRKANELRGDRIRVGQVLRIPAS